MGVRECACLSEWLRVWGSESVWVSERDGWWIKVLSSLPDVAQSCSMNATLPDRPCPSVRWSCSRPCWRCSWLPSACCSGPCWSSCRRRTKPGCSPSPWTSARWGHTLLHTATQRYTLELFRYDSSIHRGNSCLKISIGGIGEFSGIADPIPSFTTQAENITNMCY